MESRFSKTVQDSLRRISTSETEIKNIKNRLDSDETLIENIQTTIDNNSTDFKDAYTNADNTLHDTIKTEFTNADNTLHDTIKSEIQTASNNLKRDMYAEIAGSGQQGEFATIKYNSSAARNELSSVPLINFMNVTTSVDELNAQKLEPVGMTTIFNTWYRFSHWRNEQNISGDTGHDMGGHMEDCPNNWSGWEHQTARNKWSYEVSSNMIKSNRNSPVYAAFIHPQKLQNWYLKTQCWGGGDGDNDGIVICCAYMKDSGGVEHTIDLVRAVMGIGNGIYLDNVQMRFYWSLVYDYNMNTEKELANNTYIQPKAGGWNQQYCCLEAKRTMNKLECWTSQIGDSAYTSTDPNSKIEFILPTTKPSEWSDAMFSNITTMLGGGAQMGVGAHSQNGLFTILDQKYVFTDQKIYDMTNNIVWEYTEKTQVWNNVGKVTDYLTDGFLYFNKKTSKLMYYTNGDMIVLNP